MIRLFHFTDDESANAILASGFRDGEEDGVWFSRNLDAWGERSREALMEVSIDLTKGELATFAREAVAEDWDDETGDFVKVDDPSEVESFVWYEIPAELLNRRGLTRRVPPAERKHLYLHGCDDDAG